MTDRDTLGRAVFGGFDGLTSTTGVLAGLVATGAGPAVVLAAAGGGAVAAAVGMGAGDYLGGTRPRLAAVMALATLLGSLLPAVPVALLPGGPGIAVAALVACAVVVGIAEFRAQDEGGRRRAYPITAAVFCAAAGLAVAAAVLFGATG